jgi:uncharacterized protein YjgD (DUF1641 family)
MAQPISFTVPLRDPREELIQRLRTAPQDHVEALLDAYAILQELRDKGLLEIAKGALGSGEKVLGILTKTIESEEAIRAIRNLLVLGKIVGALDPEMLERILQSIIGGINDAETKPPPTLFHLLRQLSSPDARRVLAPVAAGLEAIGRNLADSKGTKPKGKRRTVTRHKA